MLIASLTDLKPIDYRAAFPQTSFSTNGPSDEFLAEMGYAKVNLFKPHTQTQKMVSSEPYLEDGWVYTVTVVDKSDDEIAAEEAAKTNAAATTVRSQRNQMLSECDWTQLDDTPMTNTQKQTWAVYRQSLRDITAQSGFPWNVVWPNKPE